MLGRAKDMLESITERLRATANVDFPEAGNPVIQTVHAL